MILFIILIVTAIINILTQVFGGSVLIFTAWLLLHGVYFLTYTILLKKTILKLFLKSRRTCIATESKNYHLWYYLLYLIHVGS